MDQGAACLAHTSTRRGRHCDVPSLYNYLSFIGRQQLITSGFMRLMKMINMLVFGDKVFLSRKLGNKVLIQLNVLLFFVLWPVALLQATAQICNKAAGVKQPM